ncbi:MAG: DUF2804 domain-containing protein [Chitinophagales bacterium]
MILPSEKSLFSNGTHLPHAIYNGLIPDVSTAHWDKDGFLLTNRRTSRKAWIFFGVYSPELICGIAIADAGLVANAFCYYYSFRDNKFRQHNALVPFGFPSAFDPNLDSNWKLGDYTITTANGKISLQYNGDFNLKIEAENNTNGASIVAPSVNRPFNFTYKNVCLPAEVAITDGGSNYAVKGNYGAVDFTKGYPPRETYWNWLAFIGQTESGKPLGLNLVKHFNGDMENILWIDGSKIVLSKADFTMQQPLDKQPWAIATHDGILNCTLTPAGARSENVNLFLMKSIFTQAYGSIAGSITLNGSSEKFSAFGVAEDHLARW